MLGSLALVLGACSVSAQPDTPEPLDKASVRQRIHFPEPAPRLLLPDRSVEPIRSVLKTPGRMDYGDFAWNDRDVPPGPVWVQVDLQRQLMSVFRSGHEIGSAVILYGTEEGPTPVGVYAVNAKLKHHRSSIYDAEMPFTLRLTDDGVAIHASSVRRGSATHGCIGVPEPFARRLFDSAAIGTRVAIVTEAVATDGGDERPPSPPDAEQALRRDME